jgi:histidine triad (HIT) family protein
VPLAVCRHAGRLSSLQDDRRTAAAGSAREGPAISDCVFCDIVAGRIPADIVLADEVVVAFLDARPVFKGHALVAPRVHVATLADLPAARVGPFFLRVQRLSAVMPTALGSQGTFVALNNVVSQSVPHLHVHVVPRTRGDGLRGFFWPRQRYDSPAEAARYADRLRAALAEQPLADGDDEQAGRRR